ncbi:hypothetical protein M404DRAFT_33044 [Pisolithus tinctorius Marx 270]|uniref:CCHC-type domain-containing protein n=1 Tax=Pisolithus tinctorius Marx 270 TaxID=870435 RepID=A0A0C3II51_PISTI|nr:hypothetical protein M404DRAFT_33044 [Pisolithus tinctorius Marx 270]
MDSSKTGGQHAKCPDRCKRDSPKLSKEEQERHKAEGLCFICHKSGHFSRNCPDRHTVSTSSKPPGVTSFGVDIDFGDIECQRQLAASVDRDPEISVNFIQTRGPRVQDEEDLPEDDLPDLESVSDDDNEERLSDIVTTDEDGLPTGMQIYVYDRRPFWGNQSLGTWLGHPLEECAMDRLARICYPGDDPDSLSTFMDS